MMSQIHFCISSSYLNDDSNIICSVRNSLLSLKPPLVTENDPLDTTRHDISWHVGCSFSFFSTVGSNSKKKLAQLFVCFYMIQNIKENKLLTNYQEHVYIMGKYIYSKVFSTFIWLGYSFQISSPLFLYNGFGSSKKMLPKFQK